MAESETPEREPGGTPVVATSEAASPPASGKPARRSHRVLVALLLVIGAVLTPLAMVTLFVKSQVTDTSRYVQTVKPLASDPAVQAYIADTVTQQLFTQVDVESYVKDALPSRAEPLAGPLTSALKSFTREATLRVVQSPQFQTVWTDANRRAHAALLNAITGEKHGAVSISNGKVMLDLSAIGQDVKQALEKTGISAFSKIPTDRIAGQVTIFESKDIYRARRAVRALTALAYILPVLVFACFGGAIYLSANRRHGFVAAAIAFTLGAAVLAVALRIGRGIYLDATANTELPRDAAAAVYDNLVRFLQTSARDVLLFSVAVVVAAVFSGPSRLAVWFRRGVRQVVGWLGRESDRAGWWLLGANRVVAARKRELRIGVAIVAFALIILWKHPTPAVLFWIGVAVLVGLALIEFYGRPPEPADLDLATPSGATGA